MNLQLVYDLACQPNSIGDVLTHLQAATCMVTEKGEGEIEVVILHDGRRGDLTHIEKAAGMSDLVAKVSQAHERHKQYLLQIGRWPKTNHYSTYDCWKLITAFFAAHGYLPALKPPPELLAKAKAYLGDAITLQIRNRKHHEERNSAVMEWKRFVHANPTVPIVIVCAPAERDKRFERPGLRFACDSCDLSMQLALVYESRIHLGAASGPAQMRWYQDKPFAVFAEPIKTARVAGMQEERGRKRMPWMKGWPLIADHEKVETIQAEYERLAA